jgi:uncharacterized damage-inducible protein DinB
MRQNTWANLQIIEFCERLDDGMLEARTPGVYGSVRETLVHMVSSLGRYLFTLTGEIPDDADVLHESKPWPGFDLLRKAAAARGEGLIKAADKLDESAEVRSQFAGKNWSIKASVPLIQAFHHCTDHRSQIATILTAAGVEPPDLDSWRWGEATGGLIEL